MYQLIKTEYNDQGQLHIFTICVSDSHKVCQMEMDRMQDKTGLEIIEL